MTDKTTNFWEMYHTRKHYLIVQVISLRLHGPQLIAALRAYGLLCITLRNSLAEDPK